MKQASGEARTKRARAARRSRFFFRGLRAAGAVLNRRLVVSDDRPIESGETGDLAMMGLDRITRNPEVMGGKACVRGMRVTVGMIVSQIGAGRSIEDLLDNH